MGTASKRQSSRITKHPTQNLYAWYSVPSTVGDRFYKFSALRTTASAGCQNCREHTQSVLAEVPSEITSHGRKSAPITSARFGPLCGWVPTTVLNQSSATFVSSSQKTVLYPASSRAVRVSLSVSRKLAEASRAQ